MASTHGTLTTALAGANNDMVFTARFPGTMSNHLKITYVDPGVETAAESVAVTFDESTYITLITVTLRSVSSVLSTAAQVKTAIEASPDAAKLVTVAASGGDTLATAVTALAATALTAGTPDATTKGYATLDELEDDGFDPISTDPDAAVIYVDSRAKTIAADTADGLLEAAWAFKQQFLLKGGSPLSLRGSGTVD